MVTAGRVPTHRVGEMRRALRHTAVLLLVALFAVACAEVSSEERALLDDALDAIDSGDTGLPDSTSDDRGVTDQDFDADDPWLADDVADDAERSGPRPEIRQFRCPFDRDATTAARCGKVELPGRGVDPDYTVELAFVRFSATGTDEEKQPDPVVYLHGGPGGAILESADYWYDSIVAPHIANRDVILYDQRGAGRSTPLPQCRETGPASDRFYTDDASHESLADDFIAALGECAERLRDDVDLTAFTSATNAQDLVDLMWALGIDEYNLHGSSYGTRLAQTVMRDAPERVRSLVLSGTYPTDVNLMGSIPVSLESSLNAVFDGCAASERCAAALPDPWATLEALVDSLDAEPYALEVATTATSTFPLTFDGTDLLNGLHSLLYVGFHAATVPDLLIDWLDGDVRRIERLARVSIFDHADVAVFVLVQCADEGAFTTDEMLARPLDHEFLRAADLAPSLNGTDALEICEDWYLETTDPIENEPVTWDVPTLLLSGAVDPITPPEWAAALAGRLPRSRLVAMPDLSHDSDEGWCATQLIAGFIEQPDLLLDTSCAAYASHLAVDELAERFRAPLSLTEQSYDFDGDGAYVDFESPDWGLEWAADALIQWRALDQLDLTALLLLDVGSDYEPVDHLPFGGRIPDWNEEPNADVPAGWVRDTMETVAGTMIRYTNTTTGVALVLVLEPGETEDLERSVLIPTARSIGGGS